MFNILKVSQNISPKKYNVNSNGKLEIEWSEGEHKSYYDPSWLRENCYTIKNKKKYISPYQLWDNSLTNNLKSINSPNTNQNCLTPTKNVTPIKIRKV